MTFFILCTDSAGGADEHTGEDEAGAGFHQAAALVHPAVAVGEGHPPHKHEAGAQEAAGGDPGDEVSASATCHHNSQDFIFLLQGILSFHRDNLFLFFFRRCTPRSTVYISLFLFCMEQHSS